MFSSNFLGFISPFKVGESLFQGFQQRFSGSRGMGRSPKPIGDQYGKAPFRRVNVHGKEVTRKACHQVEIVLVLINMHAIIFYKSLKSYLPYRLSEVISSLLLIILFVEHLNVEVNQKRNSHHQKKEHAMIKNTQFRFEMF